MSPHYSQASLLEQLVVVRCNTPQHDRRGLDDAGILVTRRAVGVKPSAPPTARSLPPGTAAIPSRAAPSRAGAARRPWPAAGHRLGPTRALRWPRTRGALLGTTRSRPDSGHFCTTGIVVGRFFAARRRRGGETSARLRRRVARHPAGRFGACSEEGPGPPPAIDAAAAVEICWPKRGWGGLPLAILWAW